MLQNETFPLVKVMVSKVYNVKIAIQGTIKQRLWRGYEQIEQENLGWEKSCLEYISCASVDTYKQGCYYVVSRTKIGMIFGK